MNEQLLLWINQGWAHPWLDVFFAWISQSKAFSIPLLALLLGGFSYRFGTNGAKFWLISVLVIGLSDQLGVLIKMLTAQPRPCAELVGLVRETISPFHINCSHNLTGMPSNHAFNFFTFAMFTSLIIRSKAWTGFIFSLATLVALSRVYLGVHYPSQIFVGALLGLILGFATAKIGLKYLSFLKTIQNKGAENIA